MSTDSEKLSAARVEGNSHLRRCCRCGFVGSENYFCGDYCDDCKWDSWIPEGYVFREKYVYSDVWGHDNATRRPELGVDFLDFRSRMTIGR